MLLLQPRKHFSPEFVTERDQLLDLLFRRAAGVVIFHGVPFLPAAVQVIGVCLPLRAENVRQRIERAGVRHGAFRRLESLRVEQNRAQLQRGVVGDAILPVRGNAPGPRVAQVALNDQPEIADLLRTGVMRGQPPGRLPVLQAHARLRR